MRVFHHLRKVFRPKGKKQLFCVFFREDIFYIHIHIFVSGCYLVIAVSDGLVDFVQILLDVRFRDVQ